MLGLAGAVLAAYAAPRAVPDPTVRWFYLPGTPAGRGVSLVLVYAGMAALCAAWWGLGRSLPSMRALIVTGALWALPLALAPPLFSRDVFSYLAQGTILHLGHNPYHSAPLLLARLRRPHLLAAVSPFWRGTTAPYGPLFLGLISLIVGIVGAHLVAGVLLVRVLDLAGLALLAAAMPQLARALGTDARRAVWLAVLSPLVMLELVAAAHNDILMVGLLAAGVAAALSGRPILGIALCALAATIKVPALAGVLFIAVAWGRAEAPGRPRLRFAAAATAVVVAVLAAVTVVTGTGLDWLSTSVFATPAKVRLAITPATAVGYAIGWLLREAGVSTTGRGIEAACGVVASGLTAAAGLVLVARVRIPGLVAALGGFLLIAAAGGPAAWPWYFIWGLALVAALRGPQRSAAVAAAIVVSVFLVKPDGILALPLPTAPVVLVVGAALAGVAWWARRRRLTDAAPAPAAVTRPAPSALTRT